MKKMMTPVLAMILTLATAGAAKAEELLHPISDEMAEAAGMTPVEKLSPVKMKAPSAAALKNLLQNHRVVIVVNKAASGPGAQTMTIYENEAQVFSTKVSTGKEELVTSTSGKTYVTTTPNGYYRPYKMYTDYMSYTWKAPMPNAVFLVGGIAIHATGKSNYAKLGSRASGGCVRTTLEDSKLVRETVMNTGRGSAPGNYVIKRESADRNIITGNMVSVSAISKFDGSKTGKMINSWDTVVLVHE